MNQGAVTVVGNITQEVTSTHSQSEESYNILDIGNTNKTSSQTFVKDTVHTVFS